MYVVEFTADAQDDVRVLRRNSPHLLKKLAKLLAELREHPRTGTGQVEQLKHFQTETWSRRISREHRLVYEIHDNKVLVLVLSVFGHYKD
ncbi:MAG: Txe/YoeB family addiction module toxin [Bacteroidaceae bacterium]|jgi:toxin YoeB|nr:Txe/YoeB family addiction module toxin [Bacteroidaceae bacterium]MBQ2460639.1 Txe/YoeB family addiction module toxin [Bacteroidaceae bacterium]MBQ2519548.1 Txe/YoeB family addiction module toxin [Bacteroidaceae bacterium]MBQ2595215.1 Txe/YoeB family addiction module toxin [Bacteroidaceae bacterium]MBQ3957467.1 Txe/YoeB family addiction module toxin [Bacteroidaceae bacterium]